MRTHTVPTSPSRAGAGRAHAPRRWWRDEEIRAHLRCEGLALEFLLLGIVAAVAGLHMAPVALIGLAAAIAGCDVYGWIRSKH